MLRKETRRSFLRFRKQQVSEKQQPYQIHPAENDTERNRKDRANQRRQRRAGSPGRPTDAQFHHPVHAGNQHKNDLHQNVLFIEPFRHKKSSSLRLLYLFMRQSVYSVIIVALSGAFVNTSRRFFRFSPTIFSLLSIIGIQTAETSSPLRSSDEFPARYFSFSVRINRRIFAKNSPLCRSFYTAPGYRVARCVCSEKYCPPRTDFLFLIPRSVVSRVFLPKKRLLSPYFP